MKEENVGLEKTNFAIQYMYISVNFYYLQCSTLIQILNSPENDKSTEGREGRVKEFKYMYYLSNCFTEHIPMGFTVDQKFSKYKFLLLFQSTYIHVKSCTTWKPFILQYINIKLLYTTVHVYQIFKLESRDVYSQVIVF